MYTYDSWIVSIYLKEFYEQIYKPRHLNQVNLYSKIEEIERILLFGSTVFTKSSEEAY